MTDFEISDKEARLAYDARKFNEARDLYQQLLKNHPNGNADIQNKLGLIAFQTGEMEQAITLFKKALEINPRYTEASLNLTIAYNEIGQYEEAGGAFSQAAEIIRKQHDSIDPYIQGKLANEHAKLGNIYCEAGQLDEAEAQYRKVLSMRPDFVDVLTNLGIILRGKKAFDEAIAFFLKAKLINPRYTRVRIQLGITYYMQGASERAFAEWEAVQKINPHGKEAEIYLAMPRKTGLEKTEQQS